MKLRSKLKHYDALDATNTIIRFLSYLGLSRVGVDASGRIVARDIKLRCGIIFLLWMIYHSTANTARFYWGYWKDAWHPEAYSELAHTIMLWAQLFVVVLKSANENEGLIKQYYNNLEELDTKLEIDKSQYYETEKRTMNLRFFSLTAAYTVSSIIQLICWIKSYEAKSILPYSDDLVGNNFQQLIQFYFLVKMCVLKIRLDMLKERLEDVLKLNRVIKNAQMRTDSLEESLRVYRCCYMTIYDQCTIINKTHGFQLMMSIACVLISVIRTIHAMLIYAYEEARGYVFGACVMRTIPDLLLLAALVIYISKIVGIRDKIMDSLERSICSNRLNDSEEACVLRLINHIHRQPLVFTAHNFFVLDYSLLCGLLNSTVTYIIILTQIKAPK